MSKALSLAVALCACLCAEAHVYNNFMQAGKYAQADMNYPLACYFYEEALSLVPADSVIDAYGLNAGLRNVNKKLKQFERSVHYGEECLNILRRMGEAGTPTMMDGYAMLADIYAAMGNAAKAECYLDSARLTVASPDAELDDKKRFSILAGIIYAHIDNWSMAEASYLRAVEISERFNESDDTQTTLNLYGNALYHNGKYEEALTVYKKQREVCGRLFGQQSREYQWVNYCIANILAYLGRIDEGSAVYKEVIGWYRAKMLDDLQSVASSERATYLDNMVELLQNAIPFGVEAKYNEDEFTALAYDALLLTKGLLLATEKSSETIIRENGTPEEVAALANLKELNAKLTGLLADTASAPKEVLNTYAAIKTIDAQLAKACAGYGNNTAFAAIGYETVKSALKDDEVLLDFADFKPKSKPRQYVCYEIRKSQKCPKVHYICNGAQLDSLLALEHRRWSNLYSGEAGSDMAAIVGRPLMRIVGEARRVYYVPSGVFHKLAIEAIPGEGGRLGDVCSFRRLSSARELAADGIGELAGDARLYGGLTYGPDIKELPRSRQEVTDISTTLAANLAPTTLTGSDGTKESFMALSGCAPRIIHLSTHGFYYTPADSDLPASLRGYNDAMSLSGLVMSGGSLSARQGLLTAADVARCNLSNTALACLASCHSGQGDITSEGIYGLQRAFKKAGVRCVVMNLWEASDVATQCFMTNFYADLVNGSGECHQAFQFARDEVRKKYSSPFYWAGFVMVD